MASLEEARSAFRKQLNKYKPQTPVRVVYLGDGRGFSASNMYPAGEPDKVWARESQDSGKPFKLLNRSTDVKIAFNAPVMVGYPESDPKNEQILGTHWAGILTKDNASAIGGTLPHHGQHEWGGGDETYVDPRQFLAGLIAPTNPPSMTVRLLAFQHHTAGWKRFNGEISPDVTQWKPTGASTYRYVLFTVDPIANVPRVKPGQVFQADISIDSILQNQGENTFRHIPLPAEDEIPMGAVLLEPDTTTLNWRKGAVNNIFPLRLLLSAPQTGLRNRIEAVEQMVGISSLPTTGAAQGDLGDLLPKRISGNITHIEHKAVSSPAELGTLMIAEFGYVNDSPSGLFFGTASGNQQLLFTGGGAAALGDLTDVDIVGTNDQFFLKYSSAASKWVGASSFALGTNPSGLSIDPVNERVVISTTLRVDTPAQETVFTSDYGIAITAGTDTGIQFSTLDNLAMMVGGLTGNDNSIVVNVGEGGGTEFKLLNNSQSPVFDFVPDSGIRMATDSNSSALFLRPAENRLYFGSNTTSAAKMLIDYSTDTVEIGAGTTFRKHGEFDMELETDGYYIGIGTDRDTGAKITFGDNIDILRINRKAAPFSGSTVFIDTFFGNGVIAAREKVSFSELDPGAEYGQFDLLLTYDGSLASSVTFGRENVINPGNLVVNTRVAASSNSYMFDIDAAANLARFGTSVAGQIAEFGTNGISFNKNGNNIPLSYRGQSRESLFYLDPANDYVGIGTSSPSRIFHAVGPDSFVPSFPTIGLKDVFILENNDNTNIGLIVGTGNNAGMKFYESGASIFSGIINYDFTNESLYFSAQGTATYGKKLEIKQGVTIGNTTYGDWGIGCLNLADSLYVEGTQVFTGSNGEISHISDSLGLRILAATTNLNGAGLEFYGRDHATLAGNGYINFGGYDSTGTLVFRHRTSSAFSTKMSISSTGLVTVARSIVVGSPTGGDKGTGTINAKAVYDDNVLLTCYPIEYARTGSINLVELDEKFGRGKRHERAHSFNKKAAQLLDLREYSKQWKSDGHLPLFPSRKEWEDRKHIAVGELTQILSETVELQAIHIDRLQEQIDELRALIKEKN